MPYCRAKNFFYPTPVEEPNSMSDLQVLLPCGRAYLKEGKKYMLEAFCENS